MTDDDPKLKIEFSHGIRETVLNTQLALMELMLLLLKKGITTEPEHEELINRAFPKESTLETTRKKLEKLGIKTTIIN